MDPTKYKDVKVSRGYTYHYYYVPASPDKPTLLFIHGFPSTSFDWSRQVAYFQPKGYGLLVPDCLGYGGTSKPESHEQFRWKLLAQDIANILDVEGLTSVIGIGHDWGSAILSRLANYHQNRFSAFAWVTVSYVPPSKEPFDYEKTIVSMRENIGTDLLGYWGFFVQPDSHVACEKNLDSFLDLVYCKEPELWKDWLSPVGKTQEWVESDRRLGRADWVSEEEYAILKETLAKSGLQSAMNYYRVAVANTNLADDQALPDEKLQITKPVLFIATMRDGVSPQIAAHLKQRTQQHLPQAEITEFDSGHWPQLEKSDELNEMLDKWLEKLSLSVYTTL